MPLTELVRRWLAASSLAGYSRLLQNSQFSPDIRVREPFELHDQLLIGATSFAIIGILTLSSSSQGRAGHSVPKAFGIIGILTMFSSDFKVHQSRLTRLRI